MEKPPAKGKKLAVRFKIVTIGLLGSVVIIVFEAYGRVIGVVGG